MKLLNKLFTLTIFELKALFFKKRSFFFYIIFLLYMGSLGAISSYVNNGSNPALRESKNNLINNEQYFFDLMKEYFGFNIDEALKVGIFKILNAPGEIVLFQYFSLMMFLTIILYLSSDMISKDYAEKTLSFIFTKVSKVTYLISKLIAHSLFYVFFYFISLCYVCGVMVREDVPFETLREIFLLQTFSILFLVAFTECISCIFKKSLSAIIGVNIAVAFLLIFFSYIPFSPFDINYFFSLSIGGIESYNILLNILFWISLFFVCSYLICRKKEI